MSDVRDIRLPADLCAAAENKFGGSFGSIEELVVFVLRELLQGNTAALDQADETLVEQRLKDLGYI